jgi:hypothetical protein
MKASIIGRKVRLVIVIAIALTMVLPTGVLIAGGAEDDRDYFFVQFNECPAQSMLDEIISLGGVIHQHYHTYRYLVDMDINAKDDVLALPYVSGIEVYDPSDKYDDDLNWLTGTVQLRVDLHDGVDTEKVVDNLRNLGADIIQVNDISVNFIKCTVDSSLLEAIASIKEVSWIQQEFEPQTLMNKIQTSTYQGQDVPQFLDIFAGEGILAEVQDNGIELSHQDLQNVDWTDGAVVSASHGTSTSGIMFGQGIGDPEAQGMLYETIGAFAQWNTGNYLTIDNLWNGNFNEAGSPPIPGVVQTNSWWSGGTLNGEYDTLSNEIDHAMVDFPHVQIHWACGNSNSGTNEGQLICESMSKNCISGGAIFHLDTADMSDDNWHNDGSGMTPSRGPSADGRVKPDLCGPFDWIKTTDVGNGYTNTFGGTSGATPTIAGSSGLAYDMYRDNHFGNNPLHNLPYSCTVKALMIADAQQYPIDPTGSEITRNVQGWGTPDMENMYNLGSTYHVINEYPAPLGQGSSWGRTITVDGTKPLKITLCWIDPVAPSSTGAGRSLMNNLDLKVTSPTSSFYWGNNGLDNNTWSIGGTDPNRWSIPAYGGYRDDRNNVENVFIQNPFPGQWTVEVFGRAGDMQPGFQDFSLVCSGARVGEPPVVNLNTPNGGENWKFAEFHDITWTMSDIEDPAGDLSVTLDYSIDGGATYPYNIITDQTGFTSPATYSWQIPNTPSPNAKVRVKVTNSFNINTTDESNNTFTISIDLPVVQVTCPAGGEYFLGGGSEDITWVASAGTNPLAANPISIAYSTTGSGGPWNPLASNEPNDGIYSWNPVPTINNANCYVRVTAIDTAGYTGSDISDSSFTIDSTFPLPATNPRAELTGTNDVTIYWTASASTDVAYYRVYYITNGWDSTGNSYILLPGSTTTNAYFVHSAAGNNSASEYSYQVRTYDYAGHEVKTYIQAAKYTKIISASGTVAWGGWVMLGSTLVQSSYALSHKLQGQGFGTQGFYNWSAMELYNAWDNANHWKFNLRNGTAGLNEITTINNTQAFWLCAYNSARYTSAGYVSNITIPLKTGWNLVPYPFAARNLNTMQVRDHLIANCPSFGGTYNDMEILSRSNPYRLSAPTGSEALTHQDAFWVRATADTSWTIINY